MVVVVTVVEVLLGHAFLALRNESVRPGTGRVDSTLATVMCVQTNVVCVANVGVDVVVAVHVVSFLVHVFIIMLVWLVV